MKAKRKRLSRGESLTPFLDWYEEENRMFMPSLRDARAPSELDCYFLGVAEKHGLDLSEPVPDKIHDEDSLYDVDVPWDEEEE